MTPWTVACQAPLSTGFSRKEYWSGLPFLLQELFLTQGSNLSCLHWQADSLSLSHQGGPSVQFSCSVLSNSVTPWTAACQASLSITNSWSSPKLMSIGSVMPSNCINKTVFTKEGKKGKTKSCSTILLKTTKRKKEQIWQN